MKNQSVGLQPKVVELEGDYFEMGAQYGRKAGDLIRNCIKTNYAVNRFYTGGTRERCLKAVRRSLPLLEEEVPHLYSEMKGIAEGARVGFEDVAVLNFHGRDLTGGCTMVHVDGSICEGGRSITGQTIDWTPALAPSYHVVHRRPRKGIETIQFTLAGILGLVGKNRKGVSTFMNILLTSERISRGVPAYLMLRLAMEEESLGSALNVLKRNGRASPFNYLISDSSGKACNVEASHDHFLADRIVSGYYVHTNHCLNEPMKSADMYVQLSNSRETLQRHSRMTELLQGRKNVGKIDIRKLFELMKDHADYPESICRHPRENIPPEGRMRTIAAVLSRQREDGIWVANGNPCATELSFVGFGS